jgi:ATP-dependent DNA ligase
LSAFCGRADYTARYPELDVLRRLPAGTLVDGELVTFDAADRPNLPWLLRRHGLTDPWRIRQARHWCSVRYVLFDLLYHAGHCLLREPLLRRREVLAETCQRLDAVDVRFSEGVVGQGKALYAAALAKGQEGVMAKHLASTNSMQGWGRAGKRRESVNSPGRERFGGILERCRPNARHRRVHKEICSDTFLSSIHFK